MATNPRRILISSRHMTPEERNELKLALRDAILFMGGLKVCSVCFYITLYLLVHIYSGGIWSTIFKVLIALLVPLEIINGILLFLGAMEIQPLALKIATIMCLFVAAINAVMGVMGSLYFFRVGDKPMHFLISVIFGLIALSFCCVLCHDVLVIVMFIRLTQDPPQPEILDIDFDP